MPDSLIFLFGLLIGSFLNVCIYRLPRNLSVVRPSSMCPHCRAKIRWYDNVPLLSFLILGGRCRICRNKISLRYPMVELLGGLSLWVAFRVFGLSAYGLSAAVLFCAFVVVSFIDFEHQIIPDEITLPGIVLGLAFSAFFPAWHGTDLHLGGVMGSVIGLAVGGGILWIMGVFGEWVFKKESMGGGDVKLLAAIGAFIGWHGVLLTIFCASLLGACAGLVMKITRGSERLPFGPYLAVGAVLHILWGPEMLSWYVRSVLNY